MQVKCSKCSEPIALTDIIESSGDRLSHVDCERARTLTAVERALLFVLCSDHAVAYCVGCNVRFRLSELAAQHNVGPRQTFAILGNVFGRMNLCPRCRSSLTTSVRAHLYSCAVLSSEIRLRAREVREAAQHLVKESQQLRDKSTVLIQEAEAALFERQRALREAMSRRAAS